MDILYHYTSIENFYKIFSSNSDKICFRATHAHYLNDPSEYNLAIKVLRESMRAYETKNKIKECKSKYLLKGSNVFLGASMLFGEPYLLSFSENPDNLTMWRTYGKDGSGVSIGLDFKKLNKYCEKKNSRNTDLIKCSYNDKELLSQLSQFWDKNYDEFEIINKSSSLGFKKASLLISITNLCFKIKEQAYEIENEWRLCKSEFDGMKVEFDYSLDMIIPFVEHYFNKDIITKIIIGPCANKELSKRSIMMFLEKFKYGLTNDSVMFSNKPYRKI